MKSALRFRKEPVRKILPVILIPGSKRVDQELLAAKIKLKLNPSSTNDKKSPLRMQLEDRKTSQIKINIPSGNSKLNKLTIKDRKHSQDRKDGRRQEAAKGHMKESATSSAVEKECEVDNKREDDSVLMASQESTVQLQSKSPQVSCANASQYKQRFVARRSPFSEIVDKGISEYLGNTACIASKKPGKRLSYW